VSRRRFSANERINLEKAHVLLLDASAHGLEIMVQIMTGFGMRNFHRCQKVAEAQAIVRGNPIDLFIVDPNCADADGYAFLKWLRRSGIEPNCHAPIILVSGHAQIANVRKARDTGANFFMVKPLTAGALLDRVLWLARDRRPFVELDSYVGPDRRFKMQGPPSGSDGRRMSDLPLDLGDANEPNMSQSEIDGLMKPQKAVLSW
jgi:DNA-binding response OmpR family regulator